MNSTIKDPMLQKSNSFDFMPRNEPFIHPNNTRIFEFLLGIDKKRFWSLMLNTNAYKMLFIASDTVVLLVKQTDVFTQNQG